MMLNGQIYYDSDDKNCVIAQRLLEDRWILLGGPVPAGYGGTCMAVVETDGKALYTKAELQKKLEDEGWQYTKARLAVEVATVICVEPEGEVIGTISKCVVEGELKILGYDYRIERGATVEEIDASATYSQASYSACL